MRKTPVLLSSFFSLLLLPVAPATPALGQEAPPSDTPDPAAPGVTENVVVEAIRGADEAPVTRTELDRETIRRESWGQEVPVLLQATPSVTQYSETGSGQGYSYFSLRGIQQTRVNMTFDGVPLNEPEDMAVYTVDFANLAGNVESIQVQRGVGTSTFGAAAFGGSVNFQSLEPSRTPRLDLTLDAGSFGTARAFAAWHSGELGGGWRISLRPTWATTDGYREHSGVDQTSVFGSAVREGASSSLRISGFSGVERIQQAFIAVEPELLEENPRLNPMSPQERDRFREHLATVQWTRAAGTDGSVSLQGYVVAAEGWYRLDADSGEAVALQQYNLSWWFGGGIATYSRRLGRGHLTLGGNATVHEGDHSRDDTDGTRLYENTGRKRDASGFAKLLFDLGPWHPFVDAQVRWARLGYAGDVGETSRSWTFVNPKVGVRRDLGPGRSVYLSVGKTRREPGRSDLLHGADNAPVLPDFEAVRPESVLDAELGAEWTSGGRTVKATLYDMRFQDEIALTGELSEIGLPLRRNVDRSRRQGVELEATWPLTRALRLSGVAGASRNRIDAWTQYYDLYDELGNFVGQAARTFEDVEPVASPDLVAVVRLDADLGKDWSWGLAGRYASRAWLDNTNTPGLETPEIVQLDATVGWDLSGRVGTGRPRLKLQVNNLLDEEDLYPRGYSYLYATQGPGGPAFAGTPYFYPLAGRSVYLSVDLGF